MKKNFGFSISNSSQFCRVSHFRAATQWKEPMYGLFSSLFIPVNKMCEVFGHRSAIFTDYEMKRRKRFLLAHDIRNVMKATQKKASHKALFVPDVC